MTHHHKLPPDAPATNASTADLTQYLDRIGYMVIHRSDLRPLVKVLDARQNYGKVELLITPVAGSAEGWHRLGQTVFLEDPRK